MKVEIIKNDLVLTIPLDPNPKPSASGKTLVVCSSHGNMTTNVTVEGKPLIVGLNAFIKR